MFLDIIQLNADTSVFFGRYITVQKPLLKVSTPFYKKHMVKHVCEIQQNYCFTLSQWTSHGQNEIIFFLLLPSQWVWMKVASNHSHNILKQTTLIEWMKIFIQNIEYLLLRWINFNIITNPLLFYFFWHCKSVFNNKQLHKIMFPECPSNSNFRASYHKIHNNSYILHVTQHTQYLNIWTFKDLSSLLKCWYNNHTEANE